MSNLELAERMGTWASNNTKKPQEAGKESWRQKKSPTKWKRWYLEEMRENTGFTQHWHRRSQTITCLWISCICATPDKAGIPCCSEHCPQPSSTAWQTASHGGFCLSVCLSAISQRTENLSRHQTWPASAQPTAHQCRTCQQQGRPRWTHAALGWGWDRKDA